VFVIYRFSLLPAAAQFTRYILYYIIRAYHYYYYYYSCRRPVYSGNQRVTRTPAGRRRRRLFGKKNTHIFPVLHKTRVCCSFLTRFSFLRCRPSVRTTYAKRSQRVMSFTGRSSTRNSSSFSNSNAQTNSS